MPNEPLLFYTHGLVGGGAERVWALVAAGLHRRGWDVTFGVDFEAPENAALLPKDMKRVVFGRGHARATAAIARFLKQEQPIVAFAAVGASNLKLIAAKMMSFWPGAAIVSVHGRYDAEPRFLGRLTYAATPLTSRMTARTLAVSDDLRRYLIRRFWARPSRVETIHNAVYLPPADAVITAADLHDRPDDVLAVGRLVPEKGFDTLLKAIAQTTRPARLSILGDGPERANLMALGEALGIGNRVTFLGYVAEPWPIYAKAKMLALPSRTEAFGNVLVEAMGFGLPIVATRCGGPDEVLRDGRDGRLVPVDDPAAMAAAIDATLADPGDPAARRTRAEDFSIDRALDHFESLIQAVRKS